MNFNEALKKWNGGISRGAQLRLAKALGINQATISRWGAGQLRPGEEIAKKIAREFKMSADQVLAMFTTRAPEGGFSYSADRPVDVLALVHADRFSVVFDGPPLDRIPNPYPGKRVFALRISGDCMEPTLHDGEDVYVLEDQAPKDKDVVLVQLDAEFTIKRYRVLDGVPYLIPDNKKYPRRKVESNKIIIRGVVDGAYRRRL